MQRFKLQYAVSLVLLIAVGQAGAELAAADPPKVLPQAHAHNDYHHPRPLLDALDHGFSSIEADVYLVDGQLLVGHDLWELRTDRTLESLYLKPLRARVDANDGSVYGDGVELTLLIDIKSDGPKTYSVLSKLLTNYVDILSRVSDGKLQRAAIRVVISGNRPTELIAAENPRFSTIDGRFPDLDGKQPAHLIPLVSENWRSHFSWDGQGEMPTAEREKLLNLAARCQAQNRRIRFWATPETVACWSELLAAHVDLIGTDNLDALQKFLTAQRAQGQTNAPD